MANMRFLTPVTDTDCPFMSYRLNEPESDYVTIELGQSISNDAARGLTVMRYDIENDLSFFLSYDD